MCISLPAEGGAEERGEGRVRAQSRDISPHHESFSMAARAPPPDFVGSPLPEGANAHFTSPHRHIKSLDKSKIE